MTTGVLARFVIALYIVFFFVFLLGPLAVVGVSAFNTRAYPQIWPIEGFTLYWFRNLFSTDWFKTFLFRRKLLQHIALLYIQPIQKIDLPDAARSVFWIG